MTAPQHDQALLSPKQVADWFAERGMAISVDRVAIGIQEQSVPGYKVGGRYVTPLPWLQRWLYGPAGDPTTERIDPPAPVVIPFVQRRAS